jgi:predicted metal-dependent hydrolase
MILKSDTISIIKDIEFKVVFSGRRSLGISVLPDSSVIVRVPFRTSLKTINRIVEEKAGWIIKHRDKYREKGISKLSGNYLPGEIQLFRGNEYILKIERSDKTYLRFNENEIQIGLENTGDTKILKRLLYKAYKDEAIAVFPELFNRTLLKYGNQMFKPSGLIIRTMRGRWGSCSSKGVITLSTELIKLSDVFIEYVIVHELCHLKHHNHGVGFYNLLSELYPEWKQVRKELRKYLIH